MPYLSAKPGVSVHGHGPGPAQPTIFYETHEHACLRLTSHHAFVRACVRACVLLCVRACVLLCARARARARVRAIVRACVECGTQVLLSIWICATCPSSQGLPQCLAASGGLVGPRRLLCTCPRSGRGRTRKALLLRSGTARKGVCGGSARHCSESRRLARRGGAWEPRTHERPQRGVLAPLAVGVADGAADVGPDVGAARKTRGTGKARRVS